ncbi:hypothetical protein [Actinomycetospora soli]|uniref:hypothetical protein n=1 Tax=Actinomycetospora soli TaxID=2893887 RepID=UPI001E37DDC3|nr:hypothetical protein [Actinomycetospora soli]MCD2187878.1 hypothetical protein [Actinomycetospora soli]
MTATNDEEARATYLGLRLAMPVLVLLLGIAVVTRGVETGCWQPSISASYYSPLRSLFVAVLCAIGTCLIVYRARDPRENGLLNVSGFVAFIVAFEPTEIGANPCDATNLPTDLEIAVATRVDVIALLGAGAVAVVAASLLALWVGRTSASLLGALGLAVPIVVVALVVAIDFTFFQAWGHLAAAFVLFGAIVVVVALKALDKTNSPWARSCYAGLVVGMAIGALLIFGSFETAVFWAEAVLIGLFAVYWIVQTIDLERRRRASGLIADPEDRDPVAAG